VKRVRFIAPARREFLLEVAYYNGKDPGLGSRFTAAVEEATTRAVAFPLTGSPASKSTRRMFVKDFRSQLSTVLMATALLSSRSLTTRVGQSTGNHAFKTANELCERCENGGAG
jgi:hypothetical protein